MTHLLVTERAARLENGPRAIPDCHLWDMAQRIDDRTIPVAINPNGKVSKESFTIGQGYDAMRTEAGTEIQGGESFRNHLDQTYVRANAKDIMERR